MVVFDLIDKFVIILFRIVFVILLVEMIIIGINSKGGEDVWGGCSNFLVYLYCLGFNIFDIFNIFLFLLWLLKVGLKFIDVFVIVELNVYLLFFFVFFMSDGVGKYEIFCLFVCVMSFCCIY